MSAGTNEAQEIRVGFMVKRSLNKRAFTKENYKTRFFVLFPTCLKYYDGTMDKGRGKEKGCIDLKLVKTVAGVRDGELDTFDFAFQVVYEESGEHLTLYVAAGNDGMRQLWIASLKKACFDQGVTLTSAYHPGVWSRRKGAFSCCSMMWKSAEGCTADKEIKTESIPSGLRELRVVPPPPQNTTVRTPFITGKEERRVAMFDYHATEANDLHLVKGEEYIILDKTKDNWWLVKNKKGQSGYVPCNYLRDVNSMEAYSWYFSNISRTRCEALLKEESRDGTYLVRDSVQKPGSYTLSVFSYEGDFQSGGCVKHYHIKKVIGGGFYIAKTHIFNTIPEVIDYHKVNGAGLVTRLKTVPNQDVPTVSFGSDKWEIDPSEIREGEEIGRGQFGCVRRGVWRGTVEVAIKSMNPQVMSEDDFISEARTMTKLQHPNLVHLYGVCTKKPIKIVVEYMYNGALQSYLKKNRPALLHKVPCLLDMCVQLCSAMAYLESKNIIHRDLAARNCLVGNNSVVKVCDFGLARFVTDDEYLSSTGTKFPVRWAAPEVFSYCRFSSKSDVWAFGILMWEIFSLGSQPYGRIPNREVAAIVERGRTCDKPDLCPSNVYSVSKRCWNMRPEGRPSFSQIRTLLESILERDYQD